MAERVLRIVPAGMPAAGCGDDYDDCDHDGAADLVLLAAEPGREVELDRERCASWDAASRRLCEVIRGG